MSDVVIVTDSKQGLEPIYGCLNLLSIACCDVKPANLNRYLQSAYTPSLLLFKPKLHLACEAVLDNLPEFAAVLPAALLVDSVLPDAEKSALKAGFTGVVALDMPLPQMIKALSVLHNAGLWYSRQALEQLISKQLQKRRVHAKSCTLQALTQKEMLIAKLSAEGLPNSEIAARLHLSPNTVKTHMQRIFAKAKVNNRIQLGALLNSH